MATRVSVLLPTYEPNPAHLKAAIESVFAQTVSEWFLFIHDDASVSDVLAMVEPYADDPRIGFRRSDTRQGIGNNWNACIPYIDGSFAQFLFQDDTWNPHYLERALAAMEQDKSISMAATAHIYKNEGTKTLPAIYQEVEDAQARIRPGKHSGQTFVVDWAEKGLRPNMVGEPSFVMLRKDTIEKAGFFRSNLPQGLDTDMWVRMLSLGNFFWIDEKLGTFRVHDKGASHQNDLQGNGLLDRLICFETLLVFQKDAADRRKISKAAASALAMMIRKYFKRKSAGNSTAGIDKKLLRAFLFAHPIMVVQALLLILQSKEQ